MLSRTLCDSFEKKRKASCFFFYICSIQKKNIDTKLDSIFNQKLKDQLLQTLQRSKLFRRSRLFQKVLCFFSEILKKTGGETTKDS